MGARLNYKSKFSLWSNSYLPILLGLECEIVLEDPHVQFEWLKISPTDFPCEKTQVLYGAPQKVCEDEHGHKTFLLRSFFRKVRGTPAFREYMHRFRDQITSAKLYELHKTEYEQAKKEAWHAELGASSACLAEMRDRVCDILKGAENWLLLGGPPCQAYSLAGRSRNKGIKGYRFEADKRSKLCLALKKAGWDVITIWECKAVDIIRLGSSLSKRISSGFRKETAILRRKESNHDAKALVLNVSD